MAGIENQEKFKKAVEIVRDLMEIYSDKDFEEAISTEKTALAIKDIPGPNLSFRVAKHKFRELVKLFGRSGFIEAKRIEGVIDESTLKILDELSDAEA